MASNSKTSLKSLLVARPGYRQGRPCLRGTGITVHSVAAAHLFGLSAEEICAQNPDLDPSLFYAALAYYFANRELINADLDRDRAEGELLAARYPAGVTPATFTDAQVFRLYHDEDALEGALVAALRRAGFDCLTVNEAGMRGQRDERQLIFASNEGRALYTKNTADFGRLDSDWRKAGRHHAGIIVLTDQRTPVGVQIRAFQAMAVKFDENDMKDRLEFLLNHV